MQAVKVDLRFTRPQLEAFGNLKRGNTVFLGWGRGTGKSHFLRTVCWLHVADWDGKLRLDALEPFRGVRIAWLMPSRKQFVDVHSSAILNELGPGGKFEFLGGKINRTTWQIEFPGGSTLLPFPASDHNSQAARGVRADIVVVDECDDVGAEIYNSVAIPWLSGTWSLRKELLAGTPTKGRHGLWYRMLKMGQDGARLRAGETVDDIDEIQARSISTIYSSHSTFKDSPEIVNAATVAKAEATTPPQTYKREWLADPDAGEGLVYPFDEAFHVKDPPPESALREFIVGVDWGWSAPTVMLRGGVQGHGEDACLWLLDEWYESECPNHLWDDRAKAWRYATFWPDPSRPERIHDFRSFGIRVGDTDNEIHAGIARVADLLFIRQLESGDRYARLYVSPRCKNTIREFGLYRLKKLPDGTFGEQPEDKNDHAMDALRYMAMGRFGRAPNYRHVTSGR
jgi:hypothetical protein